MKRIRFRASPAVFLAAAGIALAVLIGVRRSEAAANSDLTQADLDAIVAQAVASANITSSGFRTVPTAQTTKMQIAIVARDGKLLRVFSMTDAWVGSIDIAIAKARTGAFFSSNQNALTSRIFGLASQPDGPLWGIGAAADANLIRRADSETESSRSLAAFRSTRTDSWLAESV